MKIKCIQIKEIDLPRFGEQLASLEKHFTYPWGDDFFQIDHGENYFSFFNRFGKPYYYACVTEEKIIAVGAAIFHQRYKCWYLCDMKVHPDYRGKKLTLKLFKRYFLPCFLKSQRGFALTMESDTGKKNPIMKIMESFPWTPLSVGARLNFYLEDQEQTFKSLKLLSAHKGSSGFISLSGKKDLILQSSNSPMPLFHLDWNCKEALLPPQEGGVHMWQLPQGHILINELEKLGIKPKAHGLIFHHGLKKMDWADLRTSEL